MPFLLSLYAETRAQEMVSVGWSSEQQWDFVRQQFTAQHTDYQARYPKAAYDLLLLGDTPIGRLYVDRRTDEISILDITLLPEYRGQGHGTILLQELIKEAASLTLPIRLHVEPHNPARRLYTRLGFIPLTDNGIYVYMEHTPTSAFL